MNEGYPWYGLVHSPQLEQGDFFVGCPIFRPATDGAIRNDFLVCDFRSLFGIHLTTLKELAAQQSPRLRLLPPYREHLAQAFARFFMRVGLPIDVPPF